MKNKSLMKMYAFISYSIKIYIQDSIEDEEEEQKEDLTATQPYNAEEETQQGHLPLETNFEQYNAIRFLAAYGARDSIDKIIEIMKGQVDKYV